ncbi:unnamed protein product, partial [Candidula unifasciata]
MRLMKLLLVLLLCVASVKAKGNRAKEFLEHYNCGAEKQLNAMAVNIWDRKLKFEIFLDSYKFKKKMRQGALQFSPSTMNSDSWRQLSKIKNICTAAQPSLNKVIE